MPTFLRALIAAALAAVLATGTLYAQVKVSDLRTGSSDKADEAISKDETASFPASTQRLNVFFDYRGAARQRIGVEVSAPGGLTVYAQKYRAADLGFGSTRSDNALNLDLTATYAVDPQWTVRAEWLSSWNRSNQNLYDSDRHSLAVKPVRHEWQPAPAARSPFRTGAGPILTVRRNALSPDGTTAESPYQRRHVVFATWKE